MARMIDELDRLNCREECEVDKLTLAETGFPAPVQWRDSRPYRASR